MITHHNRPILFTGHPLRTIHIYPIYTLLTFNLQLSFSLSPPRPKRKHPTMHINTLLVSSLLSSVSFAAPTVEAREDAVSMMSEAGQWTITNTYRTCSSDLTTCFWSFGIYNGQDTTPCIETITGSPATEANGNATCGVRLSFSNSKKKKKNGVCHMNTLS